MRTVMLCVDGVPDADLVGVSERLSRLMAVLALEGLEVRLATYEVDVEDEEAELS